MFQNPIYGYMYDDAGQLVQSTDPRGLVTDYRYDDAGRMTYEIGPDIDGTPSSEYQNVVNPFDVNGDGQVNPLDEAAISSATQPEFWDVDGDGTSTNDLQVFNAFYSSGEVTGEVLNSRPVTRYGYDRNGNVTFVSDSMFSLTEYQYDHRDRLQFEILESADGPRTPFGQSATTDPVAQVGTYRPVTEYSYDDFGNLRFVTDYSVDVAQPREWEFVPDNLNRTKYERLPLPGSASVSPEIHYTYDTLGNVETIRDGENNETTYEYDALYRIESTTSDFVEGHRTNPDVMAADIQHVTSFTYDLSGLQESVTDSQNRVTSYFYDNAGRLQRVTQPDPTTGQFSTNSPYVEYSYDLNNNRVTQFDGRYDDSGAKLTLVSTYDAIDRLVQVDDEQQHTTMYVYDKAGNLARLSDPNLNTTHWEYDGANRAQAEKRFVNGGFETSTYMYDLAGNVTETTDRNGRTTSYAYDNLHRMSNESWHAGGVINSFTWEFDLSGRLDRVYDSSLSFDYDYTYDGLDRLDTSTILIGSLASIVLGNQYDSANNRTTLLASIAGSSDFRNTYAYDGMNRLTSITQDAAPGPGNDVADKYVEMNYYDDSRIGWLVRYAGVDSSGEAIATTQHTYDGTGRQDVLKHYRDASSHKSKLINGYDYEWDTANRVSEMQVLSPLFSNESVTAYDYSDRSELEKVDYVDTGLSNQLTDEAYTYDPSGNRLTDANGGVYDIESYNELESDGTYDYLYDNEGNRTRRELISDGSFEEYDWDHRNRLAEVRSYDSDAESNALIKTVTYSYDAYNQLIGRVVAENGSTTERYFVYDDSQIILQFDGEDGSAPELSNRYLWSDRVDEQLADEVVTDAGVEGRTIWPLNDILGTVKDLVEHDPHSAETTLLKHRTYDAFGNVLDEYNRGDFNKNGEYDSEDIDHLFAMIEGELFGEFEDLNGDGDVDNDDVHIMVLEIIGTVYGDANLDGVADGLDFVIWNANKFTEGTGWESADYNGDGVVDGLDFVIWNDNKFTGGDPTLIVLDHIFGYTGRMFDQETGLQNNLNRWYDAKVGRWISEAPIGFAAGDANIYRYVGNSPTNWIDPSGLSGEGVQKPRPVDNVTDDEEKQKAIDNFFQDVRNPQTIPRCEFKNQHKRLPEKGDEHPDHVPDPEKPPKYWEWEVPISDPRNQKPANEDRIYYDSENGVWYYSDDSHAAAEGGKDGSGATFTPITGVPGFNPSLGNTVK